MTNLNDISILTDDELDIYLSGDLDAVSRKATELLLASSRQARAASTTPKFQGRDTQRSYSEVLNAKFELFDAMEDRLS